MANIILQGQGVTGTGSHEKIGTLTSSTGLTASKYAVAATTNDPFSLTRRAKGAIIQVLTATIKWTVDGTTPTVTAGTDIGYLGAVGDYIFLNSYQEIAAFRAINAVASSGSTLQVSYQF